MENNIVTCCSGKGIEIQDVFKYMYQSCFGCEHLSTDYFSALERMRREMEFADYDELPEIELLDGDFCRVHLKILKKGLSPETLCRLFLLSSEKQIDGMSRLEREVDNLISYANEGKIPFSEKEIYEKVKEWRNKGFPPVHHSEKYRETYHPAYRVIKKDFLRIIPLLSEVDKLLSSDMRNIIIALDGRCASGKTTIAAWLSKIYDCNIFHMDDFFLRPAQRTEERLSLPGENIDHERFADEILFPLSEGRKVTYQRYNCTVQALEAPITVPQRPLNIIEGVYSLHPKLFDCYDLTVFIDISQEEQKERILKRNSYEMAKKFFSTWIPLEEQYFTAFNIRKKANIII